LSASISDVCAPVSHVDLPVDFPHGGGVEAIAKAWRCKTSDILDLSTGLHPTGSSRWFPAWMNEYAGLVGQYPDRSGEPARSALAWEFCVQPENILITAGAQAAIETMFQAMNWRSMAIQVPCYNEPIRCARRAGYVIRTFESGQQYPAADMFWQTNPANPSGMICTFPSGIAGVLDESYMAFEKRRRLGLSPGMIRLGSLTKTFCIPGLRLGYIVAEANVIRRLQTWLPPWPASTLALHVLPKLLPEADMRDMQTEQARRRMENLLRAYAWRVQPSEASFVLAKHPSIAPDFPTHRILVRAFPEWPQLDGWIRFGLPGDEDGWQRLEESFTCR